jgi:hypothetical protein
MENIHQYQQMMIVVLSILKLKFLKLVEHHYILYMKRALYKELYKNT